MWATGNASTVIEALSARIGSSAAALISRNGTVLACVVPEGTNAEAFAVMCATILGAAGAAAAELGHAPAHRILLDGNDATTVIVARGGAGLLVAVVDRHRCEPAVLGEIERVATALLGR
jgi:predicted regulator of Ras-like GTPase activity (Roadblock/LC7/MglB family)